MSERIFKRLNVIKKTKSEHRAKRYLNKGYKEITNDEPDDNKNTQQVDNEDNSRDTKPSTKETDAKETKTANEINYEDLKMDQLKKIAEDKNVEHKGVNKPELIEKLKEHDIQDEE